VRFKAGTTDYLEVLTNETNSFSAELGLAQAQPNELIALVQLYQALGGGWQQYPEVHHPFLCLVNRALRVSGHSTRELSATRKLPH
jgi:hypothetical protein